MDKAIIGGTGVYDIGDACRSVTVETCYGLVDVSIVNIEGEEICFLARHGKKHGTPPHKINYRANMMALKELGVKFVYSTAAVGSCNENFMPGDAVIISDFIDQTKVRALTIYEGDDGRVMHTDMSDPYCSMLREQLKTEAAKQDFKIKDGKAVYVCTDGPRFETRAEIKSYINLGGDLVGMTNVPEVVIAKELGLCYSAVGIITNWCTGFKNEEITFEDIQGALTKNKEKLTSMFIQIFKGGLTQENCKCKNAVMEL